MPKFWNAARPASFAPFPHPNPRLPTTILAMKHGKQPNNAIFEVYEKSSADGVYVREAFADSEWVLVFGRIVIVGANFFVLLLHTVPELVDGTEAAGGGPCSASACWSRGGGGGVCSSSSSSSSSSWYTALFPPSAQPSPQTSFCTAQMSDGARPDIPLVVSASLALLMMILREVSEKAEFAIAPLAICALVVVGEALVVRAQCRALAATTGAGGGGLQLAEMITCLQIRVIVSILGQYTLVAWCFMSPKAGFVHWYVVAHIVSVLLFLSRIFGHGVGVLLSQGLIKAIVAFFTFTFASVVMLYRMEVSGRKRFHER